MAYSCGIIGKGYNEGMRKKMSKASAKADKAVIIRHVTRISHEVPNAETLAAIREAKEYMKSKNRKGYTTVAAFMKSLEH